MFRDIIKNMLLNASSRQQSFLKIMFIYFNKLVNDRTALLTLRENPHKFSSII